MKVALCLSLIASAAAFSQVRIIVVTDRIRRSLIDDGRKEKLDFSRFWASLVDGDVRCLVLTIILVILCCRLGEPAWKPLEN